MAKKLSLDDLKDRLSEALEGMSMENPDDAKLEVAREINNNIGKHLKLATVKMQHDIYVSKGGKAISFLTDAQ